MHPRAEIPPALRRLAACQDGVVTVEQAAGHGVSATVVKRLCAQEQWQRLGRGVLWTAPTQPPWTATAWAGVLLGGDRARLGPESSGHLWGLGPATEPVDVLVPYARGGTATGPWVFHRERPGVRSPRTVGAPPRLTAVDTVLDLAARRDDGPAVEVVTAAVRERLATPATLLAALAGRRQHPRRALLVSLLADVTEGVESGLELHYLRDVERAHGLPRGNRQRYRGGLRYRSDVGYDAHGVLVELDGRLGHEGAGRFRDLRRDNAFALHALVTLRYGWFDVVDRPCEVARQVAAVLELRGWAGLLSPCPRCRHVV